MTNFDKLYNSLFAKINEDVVDLDPTVGVGAGERVPVSFPENSNYILAPEQAASIIDDVIDYLVTRNNHSPLDYKSFQTLVIAKKITQRSFLNPTKAKYAARVVHNAMIEAGFITDERSRTSVRREPSPVEVEEVAGIVATELNETPSLEVADEAESYYKTKDFPPEVDDEVLENAWNKLPDNEDIKWVNICKLIGKSNAEGLISIHAILPAETADTTGNEDDESDVPILDNEVNDVNDTSDVDEIEPHFRRTESPYRNDNY
jgi:hypothetical protein